MRKKHFWIPEIAVVTAAVVMSGTAHAQYSTGYEDVVADADGEVLTGQDGYYIPGGTDSVDFLAYTYDGNTLGIPQNPQGGEQFVAGIGPAGNPTTFFARAQRDAPWGTGVWEFTYDICCQYQGDPPTAQNLGSVSVQPYPGSASYIHLFSWVDINAATNWNAFYLAYDANGVAHQQPGMSPGSNWENLELNHWYHFATWIDFDLNRIVKVQVWDLTTCQTAVFEPADWYLEGGQGGGQPIPTGFRLFAGSSTLPGNTVAADNVRYAEADFFDPGSQPFEGVVCSPRCAGPVRVSFGGMTPSSNVAIVASVNAGSFVNPSPPCMGITVDMRPPFLPGFPLIRQSDASGNVSLQGNLNNALCGRVQIQAVDLATCRITDLRVLW